ncbi:MULTISPECIES: antibiotic biosynthesis monooxygenase family protein [Bacillaceae]|uniref:antibiotic biosynthesis monooxygenase family protein n=1 Tax=Bacillaceae TaxID=186817 RepID=UPI001E60D5D1|nr:MULTISPECIES: antibiotic biosynthesis monooxygenase [Bacillaceae]MCE4050386.1 antibiotic biosynthesis monooxygenase [Bacillus sp. Au-Bac7]MCM3030406.1 antibiotic biosynthesis monooxygenase [Niallia sp. MER 6]
MNIYLASGTYDFLVKKYAAKIDQQSLIAMQVLGSDSALLVHETLSSSIFAAPRKYETAGSNGDFSGKRFAVMNHIPVTDEHKPLFEQNMKRSLEQMGQQISAYRLLRPVKGDTYIILSLWAERRDFIVWKQKHQNPDSPITGDPTNGGILQHTMFNGKAYLLELTIAEKGAV